MTRPFETLSTLLHDRHSCRAFQSTPVPANDIREIVRLAGRVPSWCNAQPWHITVTDPSMTDAFRDALLDHIRTTGTHAPDVPFPQAYTGPHKERRRTCGWQLYEAVGVAKGDREGSSAQMMENFRLFGAPHVAIVTTPKELGPYGALDCGAFVTTFTLAAQAKGIASIPQAALASYAPFIRQFFDLPEDRDMLCAISFGYANASHPANSFRTERAPLDDILEFKTR